MERDAWKVIVHEITESDMAERLSLSLQVVQWWRIHLPVQEAQETWILSPGQENPLKEGMATHSDILT